MGSGTSSELQEKTNKHLVVIIGGGYAGALVRSWCNVLFDLLFANHIYNNLFNFFWLTSAYKNINSLFFFYKDSLQAILGRFFLKTEINVFIQKR